MLPVQRELSQIPGESSTRENERKVMKKKKYNQERQVLRPNLQKVCPHIETAINHTLGQCEPHSASPRTFFRLCQKKKAPTHQSPYCRSDGLAAGKVAEGAAEAGGGGGLGKRNERSSKRLLYKSDVLAKTRPHSKSFVSH